MAKTPKIGKGIVDPERSKAMKGNKNAADRSGMHGARIGVASSLLTGVHGAFVGGAVVGAAKHGADAARSHRRVVKGAAAVGGTVGAAAGGIHGAIMGAATGHKYGGYAGAAAGIVAGGLIGAAAYGGSAVLGRKVGRALANNKKPGK